MTLEDNETQAHAIDPSRHRRNGASASSERTTGLKRMLLVFFARATISGMWDSVIPKRLRSGIFSSVTSPTRNCVSVANAAHLVALAGATIRPSVK